MITTTPAAATRRSDRSRDNDDGSLMQLPEGAAACRSCGAAVRRPIPERAEVLRIPVQLAFSQLARRNGPAPTVETGVTTCDRCTDRRERAAAMLREHPRVRRAHGMVALDRLDAAFAALDVLGWRGWRTGWAVKPITSDDASVMAFIDRLAPLGAAASFAAGYARAGIAASQRWGHVPGVLHRDAAAAHRELIHRRYETIGPVAPPEDGAAGCLLCGVGHVTGRGSDRTEIWGTRRQVSGAVFGGRGTAVGYICPPCRRAVAAGGVALGQPAVDRALLVHVNRKVIPGGRLGHALGRAWCALPTGTPAWSKPWEHVDADKLRRALDASPWGRKIDPEAP